MRNIIIGIILILSLSFCFAQRGVELPPPTGGGPAGVGTNPTTAKLTFNRVMIQFLARDLVQSAESNFILPSAYQLKIDEHSLTLSAIEVFELFAAVIDSWDKNKAFPESVSMSFSLRGPDFDQKLEPNANNRHPIPVITRDLLREAPLMISDARSSNGKLPDLIMFESNQKLTAAQILFAIAKIIDVAGSTNHIPDSLSVAKITSPKSWTDKTGAIEINIPREPVPINFGVMLNGIPYNKDQQDLVYINDLFVTIMINSGMVKGVSLLIDEKVIYTSSSSIPPYHAVVNTLNLEDGIHTLTINIIPGDMRIASTPVTIMLTVRNGKVAYLPSNLDTENN